MSSDIEIMDPRMLERMRDACRLAADCLLFIGEHIRPGITTDEIDRLVHDWIVKHGAYPSPLNYRPRGAPRPYPKSVCTSVNEVVCHGVPGNQVLRDGDIINVDVTVYYKGHHGDTSATFYVGTPSADAIRVVEASRQALEAGIAAVRPDARIFDIGAAIQEVAERNGCSVVRDYVGHGIGREFHMPPQIPHYRPGPGSGFRNMRLRPGMVFTIEPMINLGSHETEVLSDGWTVVTKDRKLSAQFEHTVLVTRTGCEVLTKRSGVLQNSENFPWSRCGVLSSPAVFSSTHPTPSKLELKQA